MAYADTDHLFSQPIRTYKANDPYYYEVDNIPIRQLEENVLWVKDQIDSLLSPVPGAEPQTGSPLFVGDDIDLENVKQFRPKFVGGRNILVQAGRYNSRVNDAYNVADSLSQIAASYSGGCSDLPKLTQSETTAFFDAIWESYTTRLTSASFVGCEGESNEAAAYRANGLETMFTFYISKNFGDAIGNAALTTYGAPEYREDGTGVGKTWPAMWHADIYNLGSAVSRTDWSKLNQLHLKVVQHWRGVARTSVVDFRGDTLEVPPFDQYDYFYVVEGGSSDDVVSLDNLATQRIDLLVVYTHPIDASSTTLAEYAPGVSPIAVPGGVAPASPKSITTPRLGLIRGAGIGIKRTADDRIELLDKRMYSGEQKILANLNDHTDGGSNTGIKLRNGSIVHGSFPSPDDLANIAPNLSLSLGDTDLQLVGQTALPIAYVVVTKNSNNLAQADIIDIRPFLRTTELAYNERAGIAGAEPPLSFANPAVGAAQLDAVAKCLEARIPDPATTTGGGAASPIISRVYQDYIMGGLAYGVEGAILSMNKTTDGPMGQDLNSVNPGNLEGWWKNTNTTNKKQYIRGLYEGQVALGGDLTLSEWMADVNTANGERGSYLGIPVNRVIPLLPEWQAQITPETTTPDANKWFSGGVDSGDFVWKSDVMANISKTNTFLPLYAREGGDSNLGIRGNPANETFWLMKRLRIILPSGSSNFSVIANYANCWPGEVNAAKNGGGNISVCRTGSFADANGNQIVDVNIITAYMGTIFPAGSNTSNGNYPAYYCMAPDGMGAIGGRNGLGQGVAVALAGAGSTGSRGQNAIPHPKLGFAIYPTIGLTFMFHEAAPAGGQMVPGSALTSLVTGATGGSQWTENPLYPPVYDRTIIDLTS